MIIKVKGNHPFSIVSESFAVSPSNEGYVLCYSVDGTQWTEYEKEVPANETLIINGVSKELFFKLEGNNTDVTVKF